MDENRAAEVEKWADMCRQPTPKAAEGKRKVDWSVLPYTVLAAVALAMKEGALKYGAHNFRKGTCSHSEYFSAAMRHLTAWWEGQDADPDSGLHHLDKAIASLLVLRDSMVNRTDTDDRPPGVGIPYESLNRRAEEMVKGCSAPQPRLTRWGNER